MEHELCKPARWYVLHTQEGKEEEAAALLRQKCSDDLLIYCRVLKKTQFLRSGGAFYPIERLLFPGYLLVKTANPEGLCELVLRARAFPQPTEDGSIRRGPAMIPIDAMDLSFLQSVCGTELEKMMEISRISVNDDHKIVQAEGAIVPYVDRVRRLNLHKRYALVEVTLFQRTQKILFPVQLEQDRLDRRRPKQAV